MKLVPVFVMQINFKSGNSVTLKFREFEATFTDTAITGVIWTSDAGDDQLKYITVSEIESIVQLSATRRFRWK